MKREAGTMSEHLGDDHCCPGRGTMAHVRGCVNHPEAGK